jgi:hypothetical protein
MSRSLGVLIALAPSLMAIPSPAQAARFTVAARIRCPASLLIPGDPLLAGNPLIGGFQLDPTFATATNVPCAGIRVVAMDADPGLDQYCGAAYTDSTGAVRFQADCGDIVDPLPEVYLRVEGKGVSDFSVGVVDVNPLDANPFDELLAELEGAWKRFVEDGVPVPVPALDWLRSHRTFAWLGSTRTQVRSGGTVDFGSNDIGAGGPVSLMAARQYWATHFTMLRLGTGTDYRPMHFNYSVNVPIPPFTIAFTPYDTVVIDATRTGVPVGTASPALAATAHEIGHVLYNTYHSDNLHWLADCADTFCFRTRAAGSPCAGAFLTPPPLPSLTSQRGFAWYEGFADFIQGYVHQQWIWPLWAWSGMPAPPAPAATPALGAAPFAGCSVPGGPGPALISIEGNVEGLLNNVYFGPVRAGLLSTLNANTGGLAFTCPGGAPPVPALNGSGAFECVVEVPARCLADASADGEGELEIDVDPGNSDRCVYSFPDPRCPAPSPTDGVRDPTCERDPVRDVSTRICGGAEIRRPGRDACAVRVPATHTVPGRPRPRPDGTPDLMLGAGSAGGLAWFAMPRLDDVMAWVDAEGIGSHDALQFWTRQIRPWCVQRDGARLRYCNPALTTSAPATPVSPSFRGEVIALDPGLN